MLTDLTSHSMLVKLSKMQNRSILISGPKLLDSIIMLITEMMMYLDH